MKSLIEVVLCYAFLVLPAVSQSPSTNTTTGSCSPIAPDNHGTIKVDCSDKDYAQRMLPILERILKNQIDPTAFMAKLDECLKGIPQPRHLTDQQKATLRAATASFPDGIIIVQHVGSPEAKDYAEEFKAVLGSKVVPRAEFQQGMTVTGIQVGAPYNDTNRTLYQYAHQLATAMKMGGFPEVEFTPNQVAAHITLTPGFLTGVSILIGFPPATH